MPIETEAGLPGGTGRVDEDRAPILSIKPPAFTIDDPELWFAVIESMFANARILSDVDKVNFIVANIGTRALMEVQDVVRAQPARG